MANPLLAGSALFIVKVSGRPLARSQPRTDLPGSPAHRGALPEIISPEPLSRGRQAPVGFLLAWSLGLARLSALRRHRSRAGKCLASYVTNMGRKRRFGPVKKPFAPAKNYLRYERDRKSVGEGKRVEVRLRIGGRVI